MATVSKKMLVEKVSQKTGHAQVNVAQVVEEFFEAMRSELGGGNRIELRDFGVFSVKRYKAKVGRNPRTGEEVRIAAKNKVMYKVGKRLKSMVEQPAIEQI